MASTILSFSSSPSFLASNRAGSSPLRSISGPCSVFLPSRPAKLSALRAQAAAEISAAQATGENDSILVTTPTSENKQTAPSDTSSSPDQDEQAAPAESAESAESADEKQSAAIGRPAGLDTNSFDPFINMYTVSANGGPAALYSFGGVQVQRTKSEFKLQCVVQGFSKEEVKVTRSPEEDFLFIKIERNNDEDGELWFAKTNIFYHTSHDLPDDCVKDTNKYTVKLEDGVLQISIPRIPKTKGELTDIPINFI